MFTYPKFIPSAELESNLSAHYVHSEEEHSTSQTNESTVEEPSAANIVTRKQSTWWPTILSIISPISITKSLAQDSNVQNDLSIRASYPGRPGSSAQRQSRVSSFQENEHSTQPKVSTSSPSVSPNQQIPCRYGKDCYRKSPYHFMKYSHPFSGTSFINESPSETESHDDEQLQQIPIAPLPPSTVEYKSEEKTLQEHLELAMQQYKESIIDLHNKYQYQQRENEKLQAQLYEMARYHQQLERSLVEELDHRERRIKEKERILEMRRDTPSYWKLNAFAEPYREIDIEIDWPEFSIVNGLLNDSIGTHGDRFGTINGKDPKKFIITKLTRIHNKNLWHEYCFKKECVVEKNRHSLPTYESSKYIEQRPLLGPLLDSKANEYWLFHGCDNKTARILLNAGYDPRVSNLTGMFGGGFYLAENSSKSNQYIPCPGCGLNSIFSDGRCKCKNQEDLIFSIILYRAVLGDIHIAKKYDKSKYCGKEAHRVRRPPSKSDGSDIYDSVMGESIKYGGDRLQYREFILYESGRAYPEYLIQYKRSANESWLLVDV